MKKILLIAAIACSFASCKKDYVCECTQSSTAPGDEPSTYKFTMVDVSKNTAKAKCIKTTSEDDFGGTTYVSTNDCKLK